MHIVEAARRSPLRALDLCLTKARAGRMINISEIFGYSISIISGISPQSFKETEQQSI